jgi:hypothetical protein
VAKARTYRWVCPNCGAGKLAPSRPRKDDVRRYCLPCSERTGRLVERLSPSLERQRREATERRQKAAKRKRASKSTARRKYRETAVQRAQEREQALGLPHRLTWYIRTFAKLETWREQALEDVDVKIRWSDRHYRGSSGHAKLGWGEVVMTIGPSATGAGALELLLHELAHQAAYRAFPNVRQDHTWHGEEMKGLLIAAVEELTGLEVEAAVDAGHCYTAVDPPCKAAIQAWLDQQGEADEDQDVASEAGE